MSSDAHSYARKVASRLGGYDRRGKVGEGNPEMHIEGTALCCIVGGMMLTMQLAFDGRRHRRRVDEAAEEGASRPGIRKQHVAGHSTLIGK